MVPRLEARGYRCASAVNVSELAGAERPDAVVLASTARLAPTLLAEVRQRAEWRRVPVLIDGSEGWRASLQRLDVDGVAESFDALDRLLSSSLKARKAMELDALVRKRLELMLELTRLSQSGVTLEELLRTVSERLADGLGSERVSVLELERGAPSRGTLIDHKERRPIDLAVSPSYRKALEVRVPVRIENDWIVPISGVKDLAALVVRRAEALAQEELDYLQGVGVALGNALEQRQVSASAARSQQALEDAYVDRYKELVEANNRLRAADKKKNEIMAVLSHDLRAPLGVIIGYAHILQGDGALNPLQQTSVDAMARAGKKALALVEGLLDSARGTDGRMALFARPFDVSEAAQDAARELQLLAKEKGVHLHAEAPLSLDVFADEQKIRQVLQNLITNALKHSKGATDIVVRVRLRKRPDGDVALVEVRDNGKVEDAGALLMAFERSSGLGLSICREFIERHGGEIWAEAPPEGGAVFAFTLPMPEGAGRTVKPRTDPLVLLVEDDPIFSRVATMALSTHYRVEMARDGNDAVERAKALLPDLIIMDVFMPNRDGLDALRELQSRPDTAHIPVILLSARAELAQRVRPSELGAADFIVKPMPPATLLQRAESVLQRHRRKPQLSVGPGTDPETGLNDQVGVVNALEQELSRSVRYGRPCTLAVLKPLSGATLEPARCAAVVRKQLVPPDLVGHLGGGAFVLVLPETAADAAQQLIGRLVGLLADEHVIYRAKTIEVGSVGLELGGGGAEQLLEKLLS